MDLTKEAIEKILELEEIREFDIEGRKYTTKYLSPVFEPEQETLTVNTLTGLIDYINNVNEFTSDEVTIHVVNQNCVRLLSKVFGVFKQRTEYITAVTDIFKERFNYGQFYDIETFIISLQALFGQTEDREKILKIVGNIRDENVKTVEDDGISQQVTAKVGIVHKTDVTVPNPVTLKPFRTFREIEQPASNFVFRLQPGREGMLPTCALFEADGQSWILEAIELIKEYLEENTEDITIIA